MKCSIFFLTFQYGNDDPSECWLVFAMCPKDFGKRTACRTPENCISRT